MSVKHRHPSNHDDRHEQRLREIVRLLVADGPEQLAYLSFARELTHSMHRDPVPDYERGTKLVVMRWFRRGLHGYLLARIGQVVVKDRLWPKEMRDG
jgi:hypothetical protein